METAPLNLAHFHERRAERHLKRNRFDEAIKAMETALAYIEDAYKTTTIPKAVQVLDAEKWDCSRKLKQITIRQSQLEGSKALHATPQNPEPRQEDNTETSSISIHQAIENFESKYTPSTLESVYGAEKDETSAKNNNTYEESTNWLDELESKELPTLAPLELPVFDLGLNSGCTFEDHSK